MKQSLAANLSLTETKANKTMTANTAWLKNTMLGKQVQIGVLQKYCGGKRDTIKWKQHQL